MVLVGPLYYSDLFFNHSLLLFLALQLSWLFITMCTQPILGTYQVPCYGKSQMVQFFFILKFVEKYNFQPENVVKLIYLTDLLGLTRNQKIIFTIKSKIYLISR